MAPSTAATSSLGRHHNNCLSWPGSSRPSTIFRVSLFVKSWMPGTRPGMTRLF
jgi:hypothetical protein